METPRSHGHTPPRAAALRYERIEGTPPQVVAQGSGAVAERILALAREHGIPIRRDRDLVQLLAGCDIGAEIPVEMYAAVAELLTWLYRQNEELGARG